MKTLTSQFEGEILDQERFVRVGFDLVDLRVDEGRARSDECSYLTGKGDKTKIHVK